MVARQLPSVSRRRQNGRLDRGAAAVEMALVVPVLITMAFGIIDFGRIYNGEIQLSQAAREGARIAALGTLGGYTVSDAKTRTGAALNNPAMQGGTSTVQVDVVAANGAIVTANAVCVDATNYGQVTVTIPYAKMLFGPSTLTQKAVMRCAG